MLMRMTLCVTPCPSMRQVAGCGDGYRTRPWWASSSAMRASRSATASSSRARVSRSLASVSSSRASAARRAAFSCSTRLRISSWAGRSSPVSGSRNRSRPSSSCRTSSPSASLCRLSPLLTRETVGSGRYSRSCSRNPCRRGANQSPVGSNSQYSPMPREAYISRFRPWSSALVLREVDFEHEVRRLGLFPELVRHALALRRPDHDEDIGCDHDPGVALLEVQEHVAGDVDLLLIGEVGTQRGDRVDERLELEVALRHRPTVRAGVVNRGRNCGGLVHCRVLRSEASGRLRTCEVTVP